MHLPIVNNGLLYFNKQPTVFRQEIRYWKYQCLWVFLHVPPHHLQAIRIDIEYFHPSSQ